MATDDQTPETEQASEDDSPPQRSRWSAQDQRSFVITLEATLIANIVTAVILGLAIGAAKFVRQHGLLHNGWFYAVEVPVVLVAFFVILYASEVLEKRESLERYNPTHRNPLGGLRIGFLISAAYVLISVLTWIGIIVGIK